MKIIKLLNHIFLLFLMLIILEACGDTDEKKQQIQSALPDDPLCEEGVLGEGAAGSGQGGDESKFGIGLLPSEDVDLSSIPYLKKVNVSPPSLKGLGK